MPSIIMEGCDGSGKSSLLQEAKKYIETNLHQIVIPIHCENFANIKDVKQYYYHSRRFYNHCFDLMTNGPDDVWYLFDRCHLGEVVYSPMYRDYSGDYVFSIEKHYDAEHSKIGLYLATAENPSIILDRDIRRNDGKSFTLDPNKKQEEMDAFERAFKKSSIALKEAINADNSLTPRDLFEKHIRSGIEYLHYRED